MEFRLSSTSRLQMRHQTSSITLCQSHLDHQLLLDDEGCSRTVRFLHISFSFSSVDLLLRYTPPLSFSLPHPHFIPLSINKEGIRSEFVILTPARCEIIECFSQELCLLYVYGCWGHRLGVPNVPTWIVKREIAYMTSQRSPWEKRLNKHIQ